VLLFVGLGVITISSKSGKEGLLLVGRLVRVRTLLRASLLLTILGHTLLICGIVVVGRVELGSPEYPHLIFSK